MALGRGGGPHDARDLELRRQLRYK